MSDEVLGKPPTKEQLKELENERLLKLLEEFPATELVVIPVIPGHCLVPCGLGRCTCVPAWHGKAVVHESYKKTAIEELNRDLTLSNEHFQKELSK